MVRTLEHSAYHKSLRVVTLVMSFVLVFQSGLLSNSTAQLSTITGQYLVAAVGVSVGVPENDLNVLTTRIAELESQVGYKDAQLRERELALGLSDQGASQGRVTLILAAIQLVLLLLIVVNYGLDYWRARRRFVPA